MRRDRRLDIFSCVRYNNKRKAIRGGADALTVAAPSVPSRHGRTGRSNMNIIEKPLGELTPYENNPRRISADAVNAVAESIRQFGFKVPIVIDASGVIVCGHTRYQAAQSLGLASVPCVVADDLTPEQVKAFRLADNKTADFSVWDNKKLLEELDELSKMADDLFTGFELGDTFGLDVLDEENSGVENIGGAMDAAFYEVVFRSERRKKIDAIKSAWEAMRDE